MHFKQNIKNLFFVKKRWFQSNSGTSIKNKLLNKWYSTKIITPITDQFVVRSPYKTIEIPKKTFPELIWGRQCKWKDHKAVVCGLTGEEYTYSQLKEHSMLIGTSLINEGLCSGDVLALILPNCPQFISIILGASERGLTICSINSLYTVDEIAYQIKNSGAKTIVTYPEKIKDVMKAVENLKVAKCLSPNFKVLYINIYQNNNNTIPSKGAICLSDLINQIKIIDSSEKTIPSEDSLALISHSSGTTGLPKGVLLTHKNITAAILQTSAQPLTPFKETTGDYQDVIPKILPIFHNYGLIVTLCALYHGSKVITLPKFEERTFLHTLKHHKATMLFVAPPTILFLGSNPSVTEEHLKNVRGTFTGAAPIGRDDIDRFIKKTGKDIDFRQAFGQSEATCCLTILPPYNKNYESVGIPVVNTEMKVVDQQTGKTKRPNEEGEICYKGPQMTIGYLNNPQATQESIDDDGWFHTGDIGYYDKDGFFYVVDRMKELIKVKGFQVAPAELEHVLRSHPEIDEAGVIGVPDTRKGEVPIGFIKKKEGSEVTESSIKEYLATKLVPFKQIEKYIFVDTIPKSASGKILRKELKNMFLSMK